MKDAGRFSAFIAVLMLAGSTATPGYARDGAHGKSVFKACAACHATDHTNRVGPGLEGIVGRTAGTAPGFRYSNAMKNSGIVWSEQTLDQFLQGPRKMVPGTKMTYAGVPDPQERADLIAYLKQATK